MDFLERVLANDFSVCKKTINSFDPLAKERAKAFEPVRRAIHNQSPTITRYGFSDAASHTHQNPFVSKILKTLKRSGLEGYSLHCGNAFKILYTGTNLSREEERSEEVFEIRNKKQGFRLQFRIVDGDSFGRPFIHTLFLIRETGQQGSFFAIKRMLIKELWKNVLEPAGFFFLVGRAIKSDNSEIRHHHTSGRSDWRENLCYAGIDENLEPILITGIKLFYLRLGFVPMCFLSKEYGPEYMALLSNTAEKKIKKICGADTWHEITRHSHTKAKNWGKIVAQRESSLEADELEKRITAKRSKMSASNR
jgi:hypothetical protein